jgi:DNA primase
MAGGFSPTLLNEVRSRVNLVDLIGQTVNLKRAGENWKALCPFHAEKTPSFTVNPRKGIFHCFGCGAGGDALGFLMRHDRLSFPEAVRALAQRVGVELPIESRLRPGEPEGQRELLLKAMALAGQFYAEMLWNRGEGERARRYLEARGIDPTVAQRFGLGYAPDGWDSLLGFMKGQSVSEEILIQAGLVLSRQTGSGFYDRFRGRLLFPIRDLRGQVIAFGGRAMGDEEPKYLNSPETPLYVKGQTLYGLDLAKPAMRERTRGLLVEGYVDCLMAHQHGFDETVAALGTAFTASQLRLLRQCCDEVITFFDADVAGQKASGRAEEMIDALTDIRDLGWAVARTTSFERASAQVKVALLPPGHDPDSFLRAEGAAAFARLITGARSLFAYALDTALADEHAASPRGRATAFAHVALILAKATSSQEATELARQAGLRLGVDPTQLWIEAQRIRGSLIHKPATPSGPQNAPAPSVPAAERDLLALLVQRADARDQLLPLLEAEDLAHPGLRALLMALKERPTHLPEALMAELPGDQERGLLASLLVAERSWPDPGALITEYSKRLDIRHRLKRIRLVTQAIVQAQAAGDPVVPQLEVELRELQRQAREVRGLAAARPLEVEPDKSPGTRRSRRHG